MGFWRWLLTPEDQPAETRAEEYPLRLDDGTFADWMGWRSSAGVPVSSQSALGLSSVYRSVSIIAGTIAGLPLKTYRDMPDGTRVRVPSFLDRPGGPDGLTQFEWTELVLVQMLLFGNAFLLHLKGGAEQLLGLIPLHPSAVEVHAVESPEEERRYWPYRRYYKLRLTDGSYQYLTEAQLTHIPAMNTDGLKGLSPVDTNKQAIATGMAGDLAAARMFGSGAIPSGLVTTEDEVSLEDALAIKEGLDAKVSGPANAGKLAFVNRNLKITPWIASAADQQHIESRVHQVEEIARIFGVPPHLLGQTEKQTSWGTGVTEQNRGLARYTLMGWSSRVEQRLSRLLPNKQFCEFDYAGLLQGSAQEELDMLIRQVDAGILTVDEARSIRNLPPLPSGSAAPDGAGAELEESDA